MNFYSLENKKFTSVSMPTPRYNYNLSRLDVLNGKRCLNLGDDVRLQENIDLIVTPSKIAGIGVVAGRMFNPGETVIEYMGELIGKSVANQQEKMYEKLKRGCYMFKIDNDCIIDATMTGNKARFINHSCFNCKTREIANHRPINAATGHPLNKKRILIVACKRINAGEELSYDYKFPLEDAKIPCNCTAEECRRFMN